MNSTAPKFDLASGGFFPVYSVQRRRGTQPGRPPVRCVFSSQSETLTPDVPPSDTSAWRAVVRVLRSPVDRLCCALLPASCCVCSNPLLRLSRVPVCDSCWQQLTPQQGVLCSLCGEDLGVASFDGQVEPQLRLEERLCDFCRRVPPRFRRAVAFGTYRDTLRWLIHSFKYDGMEPVAERLGSLLAQTLCALEPEAPRAMLVVPVPLHAAKRKLRGFNHAELLATAAVKAVRKLRRPAAKEPWELRMAFGILERQRVTQSQAGLSPRQRRMNLRGAFFVPRPEQVEGAHVLLVDDIYTTGATARECTKALLAAGAETVWVATLARAQREGISSLRFEVESRPEQERPMHEDVAFWDSSLGPTAKPLVH